VESSFGLGYSLAQQKAVELLCTGSFVLVASCYRYCILKAVTNLKESELDRCLELVLI
jgi:hypothetical protein